MKDFNWKTPFRFCHSDAERSDAEESMHFFDSAMLSFYELYEFFQHRFSPESFHAIALGDPVTRFPDDPISRFLPGSLSCCFPVNMG